MFFLLLENNDQNKNLENVFFNKSIVIESVLLRLGK